MFRVVNNVATAPVTTAVFGDLAENTNTSAALEELRANDLNTKSTLGAIVDLLATTATMQPPTEDDAVAENMRELINNCSSMFRPGVANGWLLLFGAPATNPPTESDDINAAIRLNGPKAGRWVINFVNAAKKKRLEDSNVEGWFAELGHNGTKGAPIASLINKIAPFLPDRIEDENFRAMLAPGIWSSYRQARVSAGSIIFPLLEDFRNLGITEDGDEVERAVIACRENSWDTALSLNIPERIKAYASLFREVSGSPIEKWYQGNSAVEAMASVKVRKVRDIFRRYLEVKNDTAGINAINTIADFDTAVINDTW